MRDRNGALIGNLVTADAELVCLVLRFAIVGSFICRKYRRPDLELHSRLFDFQRLEVESESSRGFSWHLDRSEIPGGLCQGLESAKVVNARINTATLFPYQLRCFPATTLVFGWPVRLYGLLQKVVGPNV